MIIKTDWINRIALNIFGIDIYWYAILITLGVAIGILYCKKNDGRFGIKYDNLLDLLIIMLPVSIICARIYYVIFDFEDYKNDLIKIFFIRDGGLAIYGGIIGGIITAHLYCKKNNIPILDMLDYMAPSLAIGQAIGRFGNFMNIEAYGIETDLWIKMEITENGVQKYVHPTFLYEAIVTFSLFIILSRVSRKRKFKGQVTYIYIIIYSFFRALIEGLRIDSLMFYNLRISQLLSVVLCVIFVVVYIKKERHIDISKI